MSGQCSLASHAEPTVTICPYSHFVHFLAICLEKGQMATLIKSRFDAGFITERS